MAAFRASSTLHQPIVMRLGQFAPLGEAALATLCGTAANVMRMSQGQDVAVQGRRAPPPLLVLDGWLGRVRLFSDGRRQILGFFLPGDVIAPPGQPEPVATSTITVLSAALLCPAPSAEEMPGSGLAQAYATSAALDEFYLLRHIARLGRMSAYERMLDWMLEMHERLMMADLAGPDSFRMPLTQEVLSDALGLTSVHVNRTLQSMRRDALIELRGGTVRLKGSALAIEPRDAPARVTCAARG